MSAHLAPSRRRRALRLVGVVGTALLSTGRPAQSGAQGQTSAAVAMTAVTGDGASILCSDTRAQVASSWTSARCFTNGVGGSWAGAGASPYGLWTYSEVRGLANPGAFTSGSAFSQAVWSDRLVFTSMPVGVTPLHLDFWVSAFTWFDGSAGGGSESALASAVEFGLATLGDAPTERSMAFQNAIDVRPETEAGTWGLRYRKVRMRVRVPFAEITAFRMYARTTAAASLIGIDDVRGRDVRSGGGANAQVHVGLQRVRLVGLRRGREVRYTVNQVPRLRAGFEQGLIWNDPAIVPEPRTWTLLATGLLGLGAVARRRRDVRTRA